MLTLRSSPNLSRHRPIWQCALQHPICPQCVQRQHGQPLHRHPQQKRYIGAQISAALLRCGSQLALQLRETGLWTNGRWKDQKSKMPKMNKRIKAVPKAQRTFTKGDKSRVNIVSKPLVDDIVKYMGPDFVARHKGCDILDIYPGAGLWSAKLHETLKPRSHILMEPDADLYEPFLKDLTEKPGVKLLPESGIIWRNLASTLKKEHLPHQVELSARTDIGHDAEDKLPRNDTLLVTANLAFFPRRRFGQFESMSQLVLFQFISSIRASSLFQKYGLVRMLVWVEETDRHSIMARSCQRRRRLAMDGELSTDWLYEIAAPDGEKSKWFMRDNSLNLESCRRVLAKMDAESIKIPKGRETKQVLEVRRMIAEGESLNPAVATKSKVARPYLAELAELEYKYRDVPTTREEMAQAKLEREAVDLDFDKDTLPSGRKPRKTKKAIEEGKTRKKKKKSAEEEEPEDEDYVYKIDLKDVDVPDKISKKTDEYKRLKQLQFRRNRDERNWSRIDTLVQELDDMAAEHSRAKTDEEKSALKEREDKWNFQIAEMQSQDRCDFLLYRDNRHIFKQSSESTFLTEVRNGKLVATETLQSLQAATTKELHTSDKGLRDTRLPALSWDRREREPLAVNDEEFFPNANCALLDIQPKSMHPQLRAMGPDTTRAGDHFEMVMRAMMSVAAEPVSRAVECVWPGASKGVLKHCPSIYRVEDGGCPVGGQYGELTTRTLNEKQWTEILDAWMKWPFRPTLGQLIKRISEEDRQGEEEPSRV